MVLLLVAVIALAHLALLVAFIRRGANALFLVGAAFIVLAPLSVASDLVHLDLVKYLRIYVSCLLFGLGFLFFFYNYRHFGIASWLLLAFCALWTLSAFWSDSPQYALMYKGLFAFVVVSGVMLAYSAHTVKDIQIGVRWLVLGGLVVTVLLTLEWARTPGAVSQFGRLSTFGMNPNAVGQAIGAILLLAIYLALYGQRSGFKLLAYGLIPLAILLLMASGSRGAVGMVVIGAFLLALPRVKNPSVLVVATLVMAISLFAFFRYVDPGGAERLAQLDFETRHNVWSEGWELFREQPVLGHGWVSRPGRIAGESTRNLHSAYLQVLAETGIVGFLYFLVAMTLIGLRGLRAMMSLSHAPYARPVAILGTAVALSVLAHMVVESGSLAGTTINAMLLGFAIGSIDRVYESPQSAISSAQIPPPYPAAIGHATAPHTMPPRA